MASDVNLDQIPGLEPVDDRRRGVRDRRGEQRYAPDDGEMAARLVRTDSGEVLPADLLDISQASARLAIHSGVDLKPNETCVVMLMPSTGAVLSFSGIVARVEEHTRITVIVIAFQAMAHPQSGL